jgi:hypothetical protein
MSMSIDYKNTPAYLNFSKKTIDKIEALNKIQQNQAMRSMPAKDNLSVTYANLDVRDDLMESNPVDL